MAATIPGAWDGAIEVRPVIDSGGVSALPDDPPPPRRRRHRPALDRLVRDEGRAVLATLIRQLGDLGVAEDAVQDALVRALETWPRDGVPPNPRAWLLTTARHRAIDRIRRESTARRTRAEAVRMFERDDELPASRWSMTTCCGWSSPAATRASRPTPSVALSLRTLCGLTTEEVARALLVSEATMAKRLTRTCQKIALAPSRTGSRRTTSCPTACASVAATVYLVFNEGYAATSGDGSSGPSLADEAIRLAGLLRELMPTRRRCRACSR